MTKPRYVSILAGEETFQRNVFINGEFDGLWTFLEGENADHKVREFLERKHGPDNAAKMTVVVSMPDNVKMSAAFPGLAIGV